MTPSGKIPDSALSSCGSVNAGWCPHHCQPVKKTGILSYMMTNNQKKNPGSRPAGSDSISYSHRQMGRVQIWGSIAAIIVVLLTTLFVQDTVYLFAVLAGALGLGLLMFSSLTVEVTDSGISLRFGPLPVIRKMISFDQITGYSLVENHWYYGWGIRWIPNGSMYNIAGFQAVELRLITGRCFRIGTDDPEGLSAALTRTLGSPPDNRIITQEKSPGS